CRRGWSGRRFRGGILASGDCQGYAGRSHLVPEGQHRGGSGCGRAHRVVRLAAGGDGLAREEKEMTWRNRLMDIVVVIVLVLIVCLVFSITLASTVGMWRFALETCS